MSNEISITLVFLLATGCGASVTEAARRAAHARARPWGQDEIRLACTADEIAVQPFVRVPDPVTGEGDGRSMLSAERARELLQRGRLFVAWCPAHGCCGPAGENSGDAVIVHCTDDSTCEAVEDNFGGCLTVYCSTY